MSVGIADPISEFAERLAVKKFHAVYVGGKTGLFGRSP
jgi:hypothetical protein